MIDDLIYGNSQDQKQVKSNTNSSNMAQRIQLDDYKKEKLMKQQKQLELLGSSQKKLDKPIYDDGIENIPIGIFSLDTPIKDAGSEQKRSDDSSEEESQNIQLEQKEYKLSGKEIISPSTQKTTIKDTTNIPNINQNPEMQIISIAPVQTIETHVVTQVITNNVPPQEDPPQVEPKKVVEVRKKVPKPKQTALPKEEVVQNKESNDDKSDEEEEEAKVSIDTKTKLILPPKPIEDLGIKALQVFIEKFVNPLTTVEEKMKMVMKYIAYQPTS